jgi:outer membrane protein TolC
VAALLASCKNANPFTDEDYYVPISSEEGLRAIDAMELSQQSSAPPVTVEDAAAAMSDDWMPAPIIEPGARVEMSLAEVRAAALANNLDLRVALYDPSIAETFVDEERARFEWAFVASARHTEVDSPTASQLVNSQATLNDFDFGVRIPLRTGGEVNVNLPVSRTSTNNQFSTLDPAYEADARFSISHPLLRNAGVRPNTHGIRVARWQAEISDALTKLEAIRVLATADRAYWRLYAVRKALEVAQQRYESAFAQLERARRLFDAGEVPRLDVTRAESGVAQTLESIILAENELLSRQRELKVILNRDDLPVGGGEMIVPTTEPNPVLLELARAELSDFAVENRMEMLEQEIRLAIDASDVDFARNQMLPLVLVDYSYGVNGLGGTAGDAFDLLEDNRFQDWSVGLSVEVPLGNEAAESRLERAILTRVQRLATREQRELSIRQEVENSIDSLESNWQRILAARQAVILAGEVLAGEERMYGVGEDRTSTDVLNAAADLADAQLSEIRALVDYQVSQVDIAFATGTILGQTQVVWEPLQE